MDSIGERLREERVRRGFDITHIAEMTKINPAMLEAIEADDLDRLPGGFFTRSFVRQYARALGLSEDEFDTELTRRTTPEEPAVPEPEASRTEFPVPRVSVTADRGSGRNRPLGALVAFVLILGACSGIYMLWERTRETRTEPDRKPSSVSTKRAPVTPTTYPETRRVPDAQQAAPAPAVTAQQPPAAAAPQAQTAEAAAAPILKSSVPAGGSAAVSVDLQAKSEPVWVRIVGDRAALFEGVLKPGQKLRADSAAYIRLRVGRPEALAVAWNGKNIGEIGPAGQPQTVEFTAQRFRVVPPPRPEETF